MSEPQFHLSIRQAPVPDWRALVGSLHETDLESPRRSTVPLVAYWQDPLARLAHLLDQLCLQAPAPVTFSFEHPVGVAAGHGKPSYTDLMILAGDVVIAIEAKYTEPAYETVGRWLHEPRDQNRCDVLDGWLGMINQATEAALTIDRVLHLPYQLVHRGASACFSVSNTRAVLYQVFDAAHRERYLAELRKLRELVPAASLKLGVLLSPVVASRVYAELLARWDCGERSMAHAVRSALLAGDMLTFGESSLLPA